VTLLWKPIGWVTRLTLEISRTRRSGALLLLTTWKLESKHFVASMNKDKNLMRTIRNEQSQSYRPHFLSRVGSNLQISSNVNWEPALPIHSQNITWGSLFLRSDHSWLSIRSLAQFPARLRTSVLCRFPNWRDQIPQCPTSIAHLPATTFYRIILYFSLSSTFGSFLALNGQPATIEHRNNPNDDRECSSTSSPNKSMKWIVLRNTRQWLPLTCFGLWDRKKLQRVPPTLR
jgi:hypothetical protein